MKKGNVVIIIMSMISVLLLALGVCMVLIPAWNVFLQGIVVGIAGLLLGVITLLVGRKVAKKEPIKLRAKTLSLWILGILGLLLFGTGLCLYLVWKDLLVGILIAIAGVVILLCLPSLVKDAKKINSNT